MTLWAHFDALLLLTSAVLSWRALNDRDLFRGVLQFIALGLLLAVAWIRLRAPDIALAEAAVGSGLTGALLLSALMRSEARTPRPHPSTRTDAAGNPGPPARARYWIAGSLAGTLWAALTWALLTLPSRPIGLTELALDHLPQSGVRNPVTAVLLNYRGYDTLLEIGVLLLALIGVWSLRRGEWPVVDLRGRPLLSSLLRLLLPVLVLAAGYLLWIGAFAPGGAFQAGALLGGAFVLALVGGQLRQTFARESRLRLAAALGFVVFGGAAIATFCLTGGLLQYPAHHAGPWILVIEVAATVSIGLTLGLLYLAGRPTPPSHDA